ncbi:MAG: hypothetical protein V3S79_06150 [Candidatus Thermoplasmatota archaeon]
MNSYEIAEENYKLFWEAYNNDDMEKINKYRMDRNIWTARKTTNEYIVRIGKQHRRRRNYNIKPTNIPNVFLWR